MQTTVRRRKPIDKHIVDKDKQFSADPFFQDLPEIKSDVHNSYALLGNQGNKNENHFAKKKERRRDGSKKSLI